MFNVKKEKLTEKTTSVFLECRLHITQNKLKAGHTLKNDIISEHAKLTMRKVLQSSDHVQGPNKIPNMNKQPNN